MQIDSEQFMFYLYQSLSIEQWQKVEEEVNFPKGNQSNISAGQEYGCLPIKQSIFILSIQSHSLNSREKNKQQQKNIFKV